MNPRPTIASTLKSRDTEEWIDLVFYRPIGYGWARIFQALGINPNTVTILSIFIGIVSGFFFFPGDLTNNIIGIVLLIWANSFDSADGQLARMTGKTSQLGRVLDGIASSFWFISIYLALIFKLFPDYGIHTLFIAMLAGYSHTRQTAIADYYRNVHLFFLKDRHNEANDSYTLKQKSDALSWETTFWQKFFAWFYWNYTKSQEAWTANYQQLKTRLREKYDNEIPTDFRKKFRAKSLPLMKYCNLLSFNLRAMVLFISVIIGFPIIYFIFELTVMNALMIYTRYRHENLSKHFFDTLQ